MPQKKQRYLSTLFKIINVAEYYIYGFDRFWMTVNNQLTHTISQSDSKKNFLTKWFGYLSLLPNSTTGTIQHIKLN